MREKSQKKPTYMNVTQKIGELRDWIHSKDIKKIVGEKKDNIALASGISIAIGAGAIAGLVVGGPSLALAIASWGGGSLANEAVFSTLWDGIKQKIMKSIDEKSITDKEAAKYILQADSSKINTLIIAVLDKFKDNADVTLFLTNVVKNVVESDDFKNLIGEALVEKIWAENNVLIKKIEGDHQKILNEIKKCNLKHLKEIIKETNTDNIERLRREFIEYGFKEESWLPITENMDSERTIEHQILDGISMGKSVLVLGESGSGKSTLIKRVAYNLYLKGWHVFKRIGTIHIEKAWDQMKHLDHCLIVIDEVSKAINEMDDLLKLNAEMRKNIILLCAEQNELWFRYGYPLIGEYSLKEKDCSVVNLRLTQEDLDSYLEKVKPELNNSTTNYLRKNFMEKYAGKLGEFLQLMIATGGEEEYLLKKKYEIITETLSNRPEERNLLRKIFVIRAYDGDIPREIINRMYEYREEAQQLLYLLKKKGHITLNKYIETFHPFICRSYLEIENEEQITTKGTVKKYLLEFLTSLETKSEFQDILMNMGKNLVLDMNNDNDTDMLEIGIKFLEKAENINDLTNREKRNIWFDKGIALTRLEKYEEAIKCYDKVLKLNPQDTKILRFMGITLIMVKKYEEAIRYYDKALKINQQDFDSLSKKGFILEELGKYEEAIRYFDKALKIYPKNDEALFYKGIALTKLGKHKDTKKYYDKALKINPEEGTLSDRGLTLAQLEKHDMAIKYYNKALKIKPQDTEPLRRKGTSLILLKKPEEAKKCFDKILKVNQQDKVALFLTGTMLADLKKYEESIRYYDKVLKIDPQDTETLLDKGKALFMLGKYEESIRYYDKVLKIDPQNTETLRYKGITLVGLEKPKEAKKCFDKILKVNPKDDNASFCIACIYSKLHDRKNALSHLSDAIQISEKYKLIAKTHKDFNWLSNEKEFKKLTK